MFDKTKVPDSILSHMTVKDLVIRWCERIYGKALYAMRMYCLSENNHVASDSVIAVQYVIEAYKDMECTVLFLEDMLIREISGVEDIFIAVFGVQSDEVCLIRGFLRVYRQVEVRDYTTMWNDCGSDSRLLSILRNS